MNSSGISNDEYKNRRSKVMEAIGTESIALIQGGPKEASHDRFRQTNDFCYLCMVEVPHAYLLIDGRTASSSLFLPRRSKRMRETEGDNLNPEDAEKAVTLTGVDNVFGIDELASFLERAQTIYTPLRQGEGAGMSWDTLQRCQQERFSDPWDGRPDRTRWFVDKLRKRCPEAQIKDLAPTLDDMRLYKSEAELALLRRAGYLSALSVVEAMKATSPGVMEYQLDAVMRYVYLANGSRDAAYRAIIAGGDNAWYGHYNANDAELRDGDLVLVDCAPDYKYYSSDIGRMWPVNGTYDDVQRELYGFIVEYHKVLLNLLKPGSDAKQVQEQAAAEMRAVVETTTFSKPIYELAARRALEFPYHLSHPVGMAVHDVGHYREKTLEPGIVLTVDPQLIIPEERRYIRVEDTVIITADGIENVTQYAPLELDDVEACMTQTGTVGSMFP